MLKPLLHFIIFSFFLIINCACNSQNSSVNNAVPFFKVTSVIDGDTFYVIDDASTEIRVRLIGIDAPESRRSQHKDVGCFGKEASTYLFNLLKSRKVRLEYDVAPKDRYSRTLAYAYLEDGTFINALLLKQGYATLLTVPPNVKYADFFRGLQQQARKNSLGLWSKCH